MKICLALAILLPYACSSLEDNDVSFPWSRRRRSLPVPGPKAETEHGMVQGITSKDLSVDSFLGIPYADPPLGDNRFRPPQPFTSPWAPNVRLADTLPQMCAQLALSKGQFFGSEDCLYLNVYRPHDSTNKSKIPVIVWIHGGGWAMGDSRKVAAGHLDAYDPTNIVSKHGHVFVGMNYRLATFGFWALPELATESGTTGNYGLQDQRAAMQWVQRNIEAFGGDASKVTIQGESAGAFSVVFHLVSPGSKGLFRGAIAESATDHKGCYFQNKTDSFELYNAISTQLGCPATGDRLACLRKVPTGDLMEYTSVSEMVKQYMARRQHKEIPSEVPDVNACPFYTFNPNGAVVDGSQEGLPDFPDKLLDAGHVNKVPLLMGTNVNEGALFGWIFPWLWGGDLYLPSPDKMSNVKTLLEWFLPKESDRAKALELYSGPEYEAGSVNEGTIERYDRIYRDSFFHCPTREMVTQWSKLGMSTHQYVFSFNERTNFTKTLHDFVDFHGMEVPLVFDNFIKTMGRTFLEPKRYQTMSDVMTCTWASFVKCQKPKCDSEPSLRHCEAVLNTVPEWPEFSAPNSRKYMSFKSHLSIENIKPTAVYPNDEFAPDNRCDFWKNVDWGWQNARRVPKSFQPTASDAAVIV
jgi:carboxylesterase type B